MKTHPLVVPLSVLALTCPLAAHGVGFRLPNQDPEAIARGNAFTATADNPSAIYYNPAGITQLQGQNIQAGIYAITVDSTAIAPDGRKDTVKSEVQAVPQFYYAFTPKDSAFSFGFGSYAPYGLGLEWPDDSHFRTLAMEGRLLYATLNPVVAWKPHETFSIAVGPTLNYSQVFLTRGIMAPGDKFNFRGQGLAPGFTAGLLWQPHEQWSFGLDYHSATEVHYFGRSVAEPYTPREHTSVNLDFPQFAIAGVSYRPNDKWNIEVDVDWTDWDTLNTAIFKKDSGNVGFPFNFESSFMYSIGVTRQLPDHYFVSLGYFFAENSVPDRNFNPAVPDTDQHSASIGIGRRGERWSWAIAYQLLTGPWRDVENSQSTSLVGDSADGRYRFFNQAVNVSVGYHF